MEILDMKCAEYGNEIALAAGNDETFITKVLGVLEENGVYAFFLYLSSLKNDHASKTKKIAFDFLKQKEILGQILNSEKDPLNAIRGSFTDKLDELIFAKELLERTLVYARYHAKAVDNQTAEKIADKEGE